MPGIQKFRLHFFLHPDTSLSEKENRDYAPSETPQTHLIYFSQWRAMSSVMVPLS